MRSIVQGTWRWERPEGQRCDAQRCVRSEVLLVQRSEGGAWELPGRLPGLLGGCKRQAAVYWKCIAEPKARASGSTLLYSQGRTAQRGRYGVCCLRSGSGCCAAVAYAARELLPARPQPTSCASSLACPSRRSCTASQLAPREGGCSCQPSRSASVTHAGLHAWRNRGRGGRGQRAFAGRHREGQRAAEQLHGSSCCPACPLRPFHARPHCQ